MYKYELFIDDKQYIIYCNDDSIMIEIYYDNVIECIQLYNNANIYEYQKFTDFIEEETYNGSIEESIFIESLLKEIYEYI